MDKMHMSLEELWLNRLQKEKTGASWGDLLSGRKKRTNERGKEEYHRRTDRGI